MKARLLSGFAVLSTLLGLLLSCSANGGSIYATIEVEKKTEVSLLPKNLTVIDLVNTGDPALPYFVAAGAVYNGSVPDVDSVVGWPVRKKKPIVIESPTSDAICEALVTFGAAADLYGSFFTSNGSIMGLYKAPVPLPGVPYTFLGPSPIGGVLAGKQITLLQTTSGAPPYLFAVAATASADGYTYELDYSTDGSTFLQATGMTGLTKPITGVALFGGNYYVTSGETLYVTTAPNVAPAAVPGFNAIEKSNDDLRGVTNGGSHILIPAKSGTVYYSTDGTTWSKVTTDDDVYGSVVGFLTVSAQVGSTGPVYLVGSEGLGYYTLNMGTPSLTRFSDVTVTGLYGGSVRRILVDPLVGPNTVFMGNNATGLWRATFDSATGALFSDWVHE